MRKVQPGKAIMTVQNSALAPAAAPGLQEMRLPIEGMSCASCVARVERALRAVPGVAEASVNLATESATLRAVGQGFVAGIRDSRAQRLDFGTRDRDDARPLGGEVH